MFEAQVEEHFRIAALRADPDRECDPRYDLQSVFEIVAPADARAYEEALLAVSGAAARRLRPGPHQLDQRIEPRRHVPDQALTEIVLYPGGCAAALARVCEPQVGVRHEPARHPHAERKADRPC